MSDEIPFNPERPELGFLKAEITGNRFDTEKVRESTKDAARLFADSVSGYEGAGKKVRMERFNQDVEAVINGEILYTELRSFDGNSELRFEQTLRDHKADFLEVDEQGRTYLAEIDGPHEIDSLDNTFLLVLRQREAATNDDRYALHRLHQKLTEKYPYLREQVLSEGQERILKLLKERTGIGQSPLLPVHELRFDDSLITGQGKIPFPATRFGAEQGFPLDQ